MSVADTKSNEAPHEHSEAPVQEGAEAVMSQLKDKLAPVDRFVRMAIQERPLMTLGVALGAGYLIGRLIRRI